MKRATMPVSIGVLIFALLVSVIPSSLATYATLQPKSELSATSYLSGFGYRMPITVVTTSDIGSGSLVRVKLSRATLPSDILEFLKSHVRPDLSDLLVANPSGVAYPTKAVMSSDGSIDVYFRVPYLRAGVHRFYLYFGNPSLPRPIYPLNIVSTNQMVDTADLSSVIKGSVAYPAYLVPEANWMPACEEIKYGIYVSRSYSNFNSNVYIPLKEGIGSIISEIVNRALTNKVYFPVGTKGIVPQYRDARPKTNLGYAPWGVATIVLLPSIGSLAPGTVVSTRVWVASDDGSAVFLVGFRNNVLAFSMQLFDDIRGVHEPAYWNYATKLVKIDGAVMTGVSAYLVVLTQNGLYSGSGSGFQDFRFVMWYVEQIGQVAPL